MTHTCTIDGIPIPVVTTNTAVVGSGAAGLNAAVRVCRELRSLGVERPEREVALITRGMGLGTSNNSGSDKQTYYKPGLEPGVPDAARDFARSLVDGGCCHGDLALAEGCSSLRSFFQLVDLGVPFPQDAHGTFVGYKTDHDPRRRGTSAGPWTSRYMVRCLKAELDRLGVAVYNRYHLLGVVTTETDSGGGARRESCGLLCADLSRERESNHGLALFRCRNAIVAGGGPGELYEISVYPEGQMGPYAALFEAGAAACNLSESQFGIASLDPRWNLSGTYQQVIPRYYSTDARGEDEQEFLNPFFESMGELASAIFLKGYQWPFDPSRAAGGSSLVDVLVQRETVERRRRVFMDFRRNPVATGGLAEFRFSDLSDEARAYLERSGAEQATPIERLARMNPPSIELYRERGVDLASEPLEIGVCAQHCNGGFRIDDRFESDVAHLFVVGELAGTHGVKRPGGSALNAGQVGGLRAAQRIAHVYYNGEAPHDDAFREAAAPVVRRWVKTIREVLDPQDGALDVDQWRGDIRARMSRYAAMQRSACGIGGALDGARRMAELVAARGLKSKGPGWLRAIETMELAMAERAFLVAIDDLLRRGGGSRGSYMVYGPKGRKPHPELDDAWRMRPENDALRREVGLVRFDAGAGRFVADTEPVRPIPDEETWFETVWRAYRSGEVFRRDND
jgi:succinate dehydrogenase/fumarate reductase flavoprotein subunit